MNDALEHVRAEVQRVFACATEAHDRPVAEVLAWVMSLIDRERNHEPLPKREPDPSRPGAYLP